MAFRRTARQEVPNEERVRILLEDTRQRYNAPANYGVIMRDVGDDTRTRQEILDIVDRLAEERKIIYTPAVSKALETAKNNHSHYNFDVFAAEKRVLDKAEEIKFDITSSNDLTDVMSWLIENEPVPLSSFGKDWQRQQAEAKRVAERRLQLLTSILTGRKNTYEQWDPKRYKIVYVDVASLESKSIPELEQIERDVLELRRRQNTTREGQRQELQRVADYHKDYQPYRPGDTDSLDTDVVLTQPGDDKSPITAHVDLRSYKENTRVATDVGGSKSTDDPFISSSGREYTKKEVYGIAKNDLTLFRKLMKADQNRLNRILGN
jgi:hypothetical protein